jgi:hypothetical protein
MIERFSTYLRSIGVTESLERRVDSVIDFYSLIYPETISDIFLVDYMTGDGTREYGSLFLFSDFYIMEAKNFLIEDNFDSTLMKSSVSYWGIEKKDYNFQTSVDASRMSIIVRFLYGIRAEFKASRGNCDSLKDIFIKHIIPNHLGPQQSNTHTLTEDEELGT